jgi:hypothetical protein
MEKRSRKDNSLAAAAAVDLTAGRFRPMEEETPKELMAAAASLLTDDLIVEILSRLPVRSVHRFKCVCKLWRDLIALPAHRKKLPQTFAGFLYTTYPGGYRHHLAGVSATAVDSVDPSLAFLGPMNCTKIFLWGTCNGLLLCSCYHNDDEERLVVCNPATQRWTELPPPPQPQPPAELCVQHLAFECTGKDCHLTGVSIYSSRTRAWTHRNAELLDKIVLSYGSVFVGGMLHLPGDLCTDRRTEQDDGFVVVVVDMEGKTWKTVRVPRGLYTGAIGWSQGCLHCATRYQDDEWGEEVAVWCLKDSDTGQEWFLKHTVRIDKLIDLLEMEYSVAGFHPDCDTIFFVTSGVYDSDSWDASSLASWDMRRLEFRTIRHLENGSAGTYLPYVPMFSELTLADGNMH